MTGRASGAISGTWEAGILDYRDIIDNHSGEGWETRFDEQAQASFRWNPNTGELISYDDPKAVKAKGQYVTNHSLGGLFSWEIDADNGEVLNAMHEGLGHGDGGTPPENRPPVANAGDDQNVVGPIDVVLDGSRSYDPDQDVMSYAWNQTFGPELTLTNQNSSISTTSVPVTDVETSYIFTLTVTDEEGLTSSDSVTIINQAEQENQPPIVTLPSSLAVNSEEEFTVNAQASDPDGNPLVYSWNIDSNLQTVSGQGSASIRLKAPAVEEQTLYNISIVVSDGSRDSSAQMQVTVNPLPDVGACNLTDPNASNFPAWSNATTYTGGESISHNQLVWRAKWWTKGNEPSFTADQWQLVSDIELSWRADLVFVGGEEVNHNGNRWRAKWWNQNEEPGASQVWVNIGAATCE